MKSKFKVGDKVQLIKEGVNDTGTGFSGKIDWAKDENMCLEDVLTIVHVDEDGDLLFKGKWSTHSYRKYKHLIDYEPPNELDLWRKEFPHLKSYIKGLMK